MADDTDEEGEEQREAHGPRECMACRGSGRVISNLGGTPSTITCPWCEGSAVRIPGSDAQQRWIDHPPAQEPADASGEQAQAPGDAA